MAASVKFLVAEVIQSHRARSLDVAPVAACECPRAAVDRRDSRNEVSRVVSARVEWPQRRLSDPGRRAEVRAEVNEAAACHQPTCAHPEAFQPVVTVPLKN
jgi:hypothetical protein